MSADKPDPRIPPVGTYEYEVLGRTPGGLGSTGPTGDEYAALVAAQRISWSADHIAMIDAGDKRLELSIGYTCTLAPEPTLWQRFKAWVSRLFGRWS